LYTAGIEKFEFPRAEIFYGLVYTTLLDSVFNVALTIGIMLTSPLFMSVGTLLTIPVSVLSDLLLHGLQFSGWTYLGLFGIVLGFIGLNVNDYIFSVAARNSYNVFARFWRCSTRALYTGPLVGRKAPVVTHIN